MSLFDQISSDIKAAMLARDKQRLEALRGVKKEFLEAKTAKGSDGDLPDETAMKILVKMVKQRKDSAQIYIEQNRPELAEGELAEAKIIEEYLPQQMTEEELETALKAIIAETGATSAKDMGKVMGIATKQLAGKAEGKAISAKVKELLADAQVEESRIAAEVILFADKICTDEEVVRLKSHIAHMRNTLEESEGIGRKLDFIAQEMNREANTILSKANDLEVSNYAIGLKTEIEKIREQIQNIE